MCDKKIDIDLVNAYREGRYKATYKIASKDFLEGLQVGDLIVVGSNANDDGTNSVIPYQLAYVTDVSASAIRTDSDCFLKKIRRSLGSREFHFSMPERDVRLMLYIYDPVEMIAACNFAIAAYRAEQEKRLPAKQSLHQVTIKMVSALDPQKDINLIMDIQHLIKNY